MDAADFEKIKRQGDAAIKRWLDNQLKGTSVTVVLVSSRKCSSRWVRYEIAKSEQIGNGLLGIDISKIKYFFGRTADLCGTISKGYPFYLWYKAAEYNNMGRWIEGAAKAAGR